MDKVFQPLTDYLISIGLNPLLFAFIGFLILIIICRDNFKNWNKQSKDQKRTLILYVIAALFIGLLYLFVDFD